MLRAFSSQFGQRGRAHRGFFRDPLWGGWRRHDVRVRLDEALPRRRRDQAHVLRERQLQGVPVSGGSVHRLEKARWCIFLAEFSTFSMDDFNLSHRELHFREDFATASTSTADRRSRRWISWRSATSIAWITVFELNFCRSNKARLTTLRFR